MKKIKLNLKSLNEPQRQAVNYNGKNSLMIIAGPGAGKTRTLTTRIAKLVKEGYLPSKMLVTTFTKKAAEEMSERLEKIIGNKVDRLRIGTSHSLFLKIYKQYHDWKGLENDYPKLIMGGGQWMTIVGIISKFQLTKEHNKLASKDVKGYLTRISRLKNDAITVSDYGKMIKAEDENLHTTMVTDPYDHRNPKQPKYSSDYSTYIVYKNYEKRLKEENKFDFDDFLLKTYLVLRDNPEFLKRLRKNIHYIFIDEAQDLNWIQYLLIDLVSSEGNMTCVLDDAQMIYGFRGASVQFIHDFLAKYKPDVIKLEQNYRSTKNIVSYTNELIKFNKEQIPKKLYSENPIGENAQYLIHLSVTDEAEAVIEKIQEFMFQGYNLRDIAILYRTNAQSREIVDNLIINRIPHKVYSDENFYDRKEIKDMLAYLKICYNPVQADLTDFQRILNRPSRFMSKQIIDDAENYMLDNGCDSFWEAFLAWEEYFTPRGHQKYQLTTFINTIKGLHARVERNHITTANLIKEIDEQFGYTAWLNREDEAEAEGEPDNDKAMNLDALLTGAFRFDDPEEFLMFIDSLEDAEDARDDEDFCHLMTVHKSKGLEFPVVFVVGFSSKILPHYKAENYEDERRIAYVAISRAEKQLVVSAIEGKFGRLNVTRSPFISEMGITIPDSEPQEIIDNRKALEIISKQLQAKEKEKAKLIVPVAVYDVDGKLVGHKEYKP